MAADLFLRQWCQEKKNQKSITQNVTVVLTGRIAIAVQNIK